MIKDISTIEKGKIGEKYIAGYLKRRGFKIIETNMRNMYSEIDIIAVNKEYIVFVEVKTRTEGQMLNPAFAVDKKKQNKIITAAHSYLIDHKINNQPRFDIAEVYLSKDKHKVVDFNYIENAFSQGGSYAAF